MKDRSRQLRWALVALVLLGFAVWLWLPTAKFKWHDDEGFNVSVTSLMLAGYRPGGEIRLDQPPMMAALLAAAFRLFGEALVVGRRLVLLFSLVGLLATAWLADEAIGGWSAPLAALVLALLPPWQDYSQQMLQGVPAMSLAVLALAAAVAFRGRRRRGLLVVSGLALAGSFWIKPLTVPYYPAILLLVIFPRDWKDLFRRETLWDLLAFHLALLLAGVFPFAAIGPRVFFEQIVGALMASRDAYTCSLGGNLAEMCRFVENDALLVVLPALLALSGLAVWDLWRRRRRGAAASLAIAIGGSSAALALNCPVRDHQLLLVYPLLAASAAIGIEGTRQSFVAHNEKKRPRVRLLLGLLVMVGMLLGAVPMLREGWQRRYEIVKDLGEDNATRRLVTFLQEHVEPGQFMITDEPVLAFKTGSLLPPHLAVPCFRMLDAGLITPQEIVAAAEATRPAALVIGKRYAAIPAVVDWANAHYCVAYAETGEHETVYLPCPAPDTPVAVAEDRLAFYGVQSLDRAAWPGDAVRVNVVMGAVAPPEVDYTFFIHLLDADGVLCGMADLRPLDDSYRTSQWMAGQRVLQSVSIPVSAEAAAGPLRVEVGFYDIDVEAARLPLRDAAGGALEGDVAVLPLATAVRWEPRYDPPTVPVAQEALFGDRIALVGYDWRGQPQKDGSVEVALTLHWRCQAAMDVDYKVFVHAVDAEGELVAQADHDPGQGRMPTGAWLPEEYVEDQCLLGLPPEADTGQLEVRVGWYDPASGQRLALTGAAGDYLALEGIGGG